MKPARIVILTAAATAVLVLLVVAVVGVALKVVDGLGRDELWRECRVDDALSGKQGYCVVVSRYPGTPVHSERTHLEIAPVHDGQAGDYRFVAAYPFFDGDAGTALEVDWSQVDRRITVTDPDTGSTIVYTEEQYGDSR